MSFYNTRLAFLYRQLFLYPSKPPSSLSLDGQAGMVTGANTGLGYHACLQLLELGLPRLILAVRNKDKGESAQKALLASASVPKSNPPTVEVWELDLASYSSITAFVERLKHSGIRLDFAILNAGVANFKFEQIASTGHETCIQVNWLSTALLTLLLMPILDQQAAANTNPNRPRPVLSIVGSEAAGWAKFKEAQIAAKQGTSLTKALNTEHTSNMGMGERYATSKLLYQLFFLELMQNHRSSNLRGSRAVLNIVNPGLCYGSELLRGVDGIAGKIVGVLRRVVGRSASMGARTIVHAAVLAGDSSDGLYLSDNRPAPFAGYGDSPSGRVTRGKVWDETVAELSKVVDMRKLLSEI
ncbi:NAD(P)-binding protein [Aspergillus aurantiobrunneus]